MVRPNLNGNFEGRRGLLGVSTSDAHPGHGDKQNGDQEKEQADELKNTTTTFDSIERVDRSTIEREHPHRHRRLQRHDDRDPNRHTTAGRVLVLRWPRPPCDSRVIMSARTEWWSLVAPEGVLEQVPT